MAVRPKRRLEFQIDKLTRSVENLATGESFETKGIQLTLNDKQLLKLSKWSFNWEHDLNQVDREVYGLVLRNSFNLLQGLASAEAFSDHLYLHLLESASFNRGPEKRYAGVAGNLVAFLCKVSFEKRFRGNLVFEPKTKLIRHYEESLGAKRITRSRMFIGTPEARRLVLQYYPDFPYDQF